jgi:tRNA(Ile)-lysidine synthase
VRRPPAVARVLERVTATIREHDLVHPGQGVLAAVSGGPDSMCLLDSLVRLRRLLKIRVDVVHVDHALREGSRADAAYVRRACSRLRVPFHLRTVTVGPPAGGSLEAWARGERLQAFAAVARDADLPRIATGHTRDDLAETVLLRVLTGSGTTGVAAIRYHQGPMIRPLLDVGRDEVETYCRALGLRPRIDPTNADPSYALRNALRLRGIPALEQALGRGVREPLARSARLLSDDDAELEGQMWTMWDAVVDEIEEGIALGAVALLDLPRAVSSRLVSRAIVRCRTTPSRADVDAVLDLASGRPGRTRDLSHGLKARRDREYVRLLRPSPGNA